MTTPTERILAALAERNCDPKRNGSGWSARCPAHEDRRPSLSVSEGDDGRCLLDCKTGCDTKDIVAVVGLTMRDLFPDAAPIQTQRKPSHHNGKATGKTYPTAKAAIDALERKHGKRSARWIYHDADGDPIGVIVRWDRAGGKDIRPVARRGDRWIIGGMPAPRPLYGLPDLAGADQVTSPRAKKRRTLPARSA